MSSKVSTSSEKLKKEVGKELITELEKSIARAELMELFYQRKVISGDKSVQLMLGKTQAELRQWKELVAFLEEKTV